MSGDKCGHNNHSHYMIWWCLWMLFMAQFMDCGGSHSEMKHDIADTERKISGLEIDISNLRIKVNRQERDISNLEDEVTLLKNKNFYQDQDFEILKKECKKDIGSAMPKRTR